MRQALHIFGKDVRGSAYEIFVTLVLATVFAVEGSGHFGWLGLFIGLLPVSWWLLTVSVIHAEAIPGDRQFWLTRPYSWKSLLGAKIAFLVVTIGPPMVISDAVILHSQGFPVASNAGGILWHMVLRFLLFIVPAIVLASLTRTMAAFIVSALGAVLAIFLGAGFMSAEGIMLWEGWGWVSVAIATIALIFQYARRSRIGLALAISAVALPLISAHVPLPARFPSNLIEPRAGEPALQFLIPDAKEIPPNTISALPGQAMIALPIQVDGIPAELDLRAGDVEVMIQERDGTAWRNNSPAGFLAGPHGFWETIPIPERVYERVKSQPVQIYTRLDLTLYRTATTLGIRNGPFEIPGVARCWRYTNTLDCQAALRRPDQLLFLYDANGERIEPLGALGSISSVEAGLGPIVTFYEHLPREVATIVVAEPVSRLRRDFYLRDVVLEPNAITRK
jgi:hypothetical protein